MIKNNYVKYRLGEYMEYNIATKCLYGNKKSPSCDSSGAISFPIYQTATFAHKGVGEIIVGCKIQRESSLRMWLHLWKMELMHWLIPVVWQRYQP